MRNLRLSGQINSGALFIECEICLLEITGLGSVLSYRNSQNNQFNQTPAQFIGRNLFDEITLFDTTEELLRRFDRFVEGKDPPQKFTFDCRTKNKVFPAKIMPVRVGCLSNRERDQRIIFDIRKI